jgi:hypothetical protein
LIPINGKRKQGRSVKTWRKTLQEAPQNVNVRLDGAETAAAAATVENAFCPMCPAAQEEVRIRLD